MLHTHSRRQTTSGFFQWIKKKNIQSIHTWIGQWWFWFLGLFDDDDDDDDCNKLWELFRRILPLVIVVLLRKARFGDDNILLL